MNPRRLAVAFALAAFLATPDLDARDPIADSIAGIYSDGGSSIPYRLYRPAGYDVADSSHPLIVFLHGSGERGSNNPSQVTNHIGNLINATESGAFGAYLLAPQAPSNGWWSNTGNLNDTTPLRLTLQLIDQFAADNNVDRSRIYITGISMGGFGVFDAIESRPDLFALGVSLSGGGRVTAGEIYATVPIWAFHGSADGNVPASWSRDAIAAAINAGGLEQRYTEIAGGGHSGWSTIYDPRNRYLADIDFTGEYRADYPAGGFQSIYTWMFAQTNAVPEPHMFALLGLAGIAVLLHRMRRAH